MDKWFLFTVRKRPSRTVDKWLSRYRRLLWAVKRLEKNDYHLYPKRFILSLCLEILCQAEFQTLNLHTTFLIKYLCIINGSHTVKIYCSQIYESVPVHTQSESNIFIGFGSRKRSTVVAMKWIIALIYIQHEN